MLPTTLKKLGDGAFEGCTEISSLSLLTGVEEIDASAFAGCTGFGGSVATPSSLAKLDGTAFAGCGVRALASCDRRSLKWK